MLFCLPVIPVQAQTIHSIRVGENKHDGGLTELREEGSHIVTAVIDPTTLVLDNKKVVRLAGIDLPIYPGEKENAFAVLAMQRLQALFLGQKVILFQAKDEEKGRINAMNQTMGHILKREGDKEIWAQKMLVEEGLVRVLPTISNPEGASLLFTAEDKPREGRKGLWSTQPWAVKSPDTVMDYVGTIQVVQGKIASVATRNNVTYLNFGRDWKTDFTIVVDATTRRALMRNKINPMGLANKIVEVRGFVEDLNGPSITLDSPAVLRVLPSSVAVDAPAKEEAPKPSATEPEIKKETLKD